MNTFATPRYRYAAIVLAGLKLWFVAAQPVVAIGPAIFDDRLFLELAQHILQGDWLGPYSELTLAKGPMYSIWIALTFVLGVPLPLANQAIYLVACWLVVRALRPHLASDAVAFAIVALLWLNPMSFEAPVLGRVLRQNIYTPAALLLFAGLVAFETRRRESVGVRLGWGALTGTSFAALWLTREESIWIVPSIVLLLGSAVWSSWRPERARALVAPLASAIGCSAVALGTVCMLNYRHYGWFGTVEFRAPQFVAAYGALQRVDVRQRIPYVPVTREAREKCYRVSPAFAELQPFLEGDFGRWATAASWMTGRPPPELEMAGGWFMWALRGAAAAAGHHESAAEALAYYERIATEVNRACDEGKLPSHPRQDSMMPRWTLQDLRRFVGTLPEFFDYFSTFRGFSARGPRSDGNAEQLMLFRDLTRWPSTLSPSAPELALPLQERFDGWRVSALHGLGKAMRWIGAGVVMGGAALWIWLLLRAILTRRPSHLFVIATALLGATLAVILINALVHVLSFPNLSPGAFAQAYPLALLFGALSWYEALDGLVRRIPND